VKQKRAIEGTSRALPTDMYDAETIEAINVEQLVTATDRMLLRGRVARRRPIAPGLAPQGRDPYPRTVSYMATPARDPAPRIAAPAPSATPARDLYRQMVASIALARGSQSRIAPRGEPTLQMRAQPSSARAQVFAITVVIPTLVGIAVGLAALL
jgi:hypothetical protein